MKIKKIGNWYYAYSPQGEIVGKSKLRGKALGMAKQAASEQLDTKAERNAELEDPNVKFIKYTLDQMNYLYNRKEATDGEANS